jgi:DNA polymerase-3 subunit epsilon
MKVRSWPFTGAIGIREKSDTSERTEIHVFNHWCHLGTVDSEDRLWDILDSSDMLPFDLDGYKILTRFLEKNRQEIDLINLSFDECAIRIG